MGKRKILKYNPIDLFAISDSRRGDLDRFLCRACPGYILRVRFSLAHEEDSAKPKKSSGPVHPFPPPSSCPPSSFLSSFWK